MIDIVIPRPARLAARPALTRIAHSLRNVAPRVASVLPGVVCRGAPRDAAGRPLVYFTIDDGPDPVGTPILLETLASEDAGATFFILASRAARDTGLLRAIIDAGHGVGNHGWSHIDAWRDAAATQDLQRGQRWLQDRLGVDIVEVRPPYGHVSPAMLRWALAERRRIVLWDAMPGDYDPTGKATHMAEWLSRHVRPGSIPVLHDAGPAERAAATLRIILPRLRGEGWRFPTL